jgi:hypothetical protein
MLAESYDLRLCVHELLWGFSCFWQGHMIINLAVVLYISFMWIFLVMWHGLQGPIFYAD